MTVFYAARPGGTNLRKAMVVGGTIGLVAAIAYIAMISQRSGCGLRACKSFVPYNIQSGKARDENSSQEILLSLSLFLGFAFFD